MSKHIFLIIFSFLILVGCQQPTDEEKPAIVSVGIVGSRADVDSIFVEAKELRLRTSSDSIVIFNGSANYNLLRKRGDDPDYIASDVSMDATTISDVRIKIDKAVVWKNGKSQNMTIPQSLVNGYTLTVEEGSIMSGTEYNIVILVDIARSVIKTKSNNYYLRPVAKAVVVATTGKITGKLSGWTNNPTLYAIYGLIDTVSSTKPDTSGAFTFSYLEPKTYRISVHDTLNFIKNYPPGSFYTVKRDEVTQTGDLLR